MSCRDTVEQGQGLWKQYPKEQGSAPLRTIGWLDSEQSSGTGTGTVEMPAELPDLTATSGNSLLPRDLGRGEVGQGTLSTLCLGFLIWSIAVAPDEGENADE